MHYIDLATRKVFEDMGQYRQFTGVFNNAKELQELLQSIRYFKGFKNPLKCRTVVKRFEKETNQKVLY